jgi:hypothetical protein
MSGREIKRFVDGALILAAVPAWLYCASTARTGGYLNTLKLDSDVLGGDFYTTIYNGVIVSAAPIFVVLATFLTLLFVFSHMIAPSYIEYLKSGYRARKRVVKMRRFFKGKRADTIFEIKAKRRTNVFLLVSLGLLLFIFFLAWVEGKGKATAVTLLEQISEETVPVSGFVSVEVEGAVKKMVHLACGTKSCAAMDVASKRVYYYDQSKGFSFILRE